MRRLGPGLLAAALVLALVGVGILRPPPAPAARRAPDGGRARLESTRVRAPVRVALFGDSLAHQARSALVTGFAGDGRELVALSTRPGAALCDDRAEIVRALVTRRLDVLVLEYSGNSFTACMRDATTGDLLAIGSGAWSRRYEADLRAIAKAAAAAGTPVLWVTAPSVRHPGAPVDYPDRIAGVARRVARDRPAVRVADAGRALDGDSGYAASLPCAADEAWACVDGRVAVRADDGLHFDCHGLVDPLGGCAGYSAGGRRYADAIVAALGGLGQLQPLPAPLTIPKGPLGQR